MAAVRVALVAVLVTVLLPADALGHAKLLRSSPSGGDVLERAPRAVVLTFDEGIDSAFVQLQVYDTAGRRVDRGAPYHPDGREELVAVRLRPRLAGRFVARYRVISEDGHPVAKRTAFRVKRTPRQRGDPMESPDAGGAPMAPTENGHAQSVTGEVTQVAFAVTRGTGYLAIALATGGVVFLLVVWLPAVARWAGAGAEWRAVSERFAGRLRHVLFGAVVVGLLSTVLAIVLEGATAVGVSFWAAFDADVLETTSETRVVQAWVARFLVWLILGALILVALRPHRAPVLRRAALGADGVALGASPSRAWQLALLSVLLALAFTAPMAGHAGTYSPSGVLIGTDTLHVLSMSCWLGGLVLLLVVVPGAIRALEPHDRTRLLAGVVGRFSRLATVAVALLLLSGIVQSVALVGSVPALVDTAYGRLVLAKIALFLALMGLGAYNQRRLVPQLFTLAAGGREPGRTATVLRRSVALEVGFALIVLAVTAVLVVTEPAAGS
jgi:copper transport protein